MSSTEDDWWDRLYGDESAEDRSHQETPKVKAPRASKARWFAPKEDYFPRPSMPARPALSEGSRKLIYNVSAAGAGYCFGLIRMIDGWIETCGREASIGSALLLGAGICLAVAAIWDRRTRHWKPGVLAWVARVPLASAVTALALYAPASQIR